MIRTLLIPATLLGLITLAMTPQAPAQMTSGATGTCASGGGVWTPSPVQHSETGDATNPAFHTVYGIFCNGKVYMIRLSNKVNNNQIVVDVLGSVSLGCSNGTWSPTPAQHTEAGTPVNPSFHTIWPLNCGGDVYMIRFSNKVGGSRIVVDSLGKAPLN